MTDHITLRILHELEIDQLVEVHNSIPGVREVTRMGDLGTARKRVELALERAGMRMARVRPRGYRVVPLDEPVGVDRRIVWLAPNPRPVWSRSHARYERLRVGMTIREYLDLAPEMGVRRVKARQDIYHDLTKGFIHLAGETEQTTSFP